MFPQGGPGIGLLLLRIAAAAMFALNLTQRVDFNSSVLYWSIVSLIVLVALALVVGFLTPVLSIVACVAAIANLFLAEQTINILGILTSAALFLLGPGAYSVDARLFGLRVTVVPPRKNQSPQI